MSIGQFMPLFSKTAGFTKDPYSEYVIMDLNMDNNGDGVTLVDRSFYGNTFVPAGDAKLTQAQKKFGKFSAAFDGTGDYYHSAAKSLYNMPAEFTMECWIYHTGSLENGFIVSHGTTGTWNEPSLLILKSDQKLKISSPGGTYIISSINSIPLNQWVHISYGRKGSNYYMYVDGILQGVWANSSSLTGWSCTIGTAGWSRITGTAGMYKGYIDHLRWWKGVSVRDGVNNFIPPKAPWEPPHKGLFTPTYITCGTLRSAWFGYNKTVDQYYAVTGSINAQPFEGLSVLRIHGYYGGPYDGYNGMLELEGTFTVEEAARINRLVPPLRLRRNTVILNLPPFTRDANGQLSAFGNVQGNLNLFVAGSVVFLESQNAPVGGTPVSP